MKEKIQIFLVYYSNFIFYLITTTILLIALVINRYNYICFFGTTVALVLLLSFRNIYNSNYYKLLKFYSDHIFKKYEEDYKSLYYIDLEKMKVKKFIFTGSSYQTKVILYLYLYLLSVPDSKLTLKGNMNCQTSDYKIIVCKSQTYAYMHIAKLKNL